VAGDLSGGVLTASWMQRPNVVAVLSALGAPEVDVRFVGGCVRDSILGRPVVDIDLATPDFPETVMKKASAAGLKVVPTGLSHGTVTVVSDGCGFEVTTLRKDTATDGRHADVEFTTDWAEDAARRDFTFNAMSARADGKIFDLFGGHEDANAGRVCFIGNPRDRIQEDYLRILRYFRFLAHYGKEPPSDEVLAVCQELRAGLAQLSSERIRDELTKLMSAPDPSRAISAMICTSILEDVLPEAHAPDRFERLIQTEKRVAIDLSKAAWRRRLMFLVHEQALATDEIRKRLKLSNADLKALSQIQRAATDAKRAFDQPHRNRFLYAYEPEYSKDAVLIAWARDPVSGEADWEILYQAAVDWTPKTFPLGGSDAKVLGLPEGPEVGKVLKRLEREWVDGGCRTTAQDLRRRMKELVEQAKSRP
jgi:poly(A) polymerase